MSGQGKDRSKPRSATRARRGTRGRPEDALGTTEERYGSVVAALAEGIVFMDADGRLQASNASAALPECLPLVNPPHHRPRPPDARRGGGAVLIAVALLQPIAQLLTCERPTQLSRRPRLQPPPQSRIPRRSTPAILADGSTG